MALAPPFTAETAQLKVKKAQDLWNTRDPLAIAKAYTQDSIWRNRGTFLKGTQDIVDFLTAKWEKEKNYRLRKELFAFTDNKIAVQFWYEFQDRSEQLRWKRCYGLEGKLNLVLGTALSKTYDKARRYGHGLCPNAPQTGPLTKRAK